MSGKRLYRIVFQLILVFVLLELGLRVILFQRTIGGPLAITGVWRNIKGRIHRVRPTYLYKGFYLARPDSGKAVNEEIAYESYESNRMEYAPWIDYRSRDYHGRYVNTSGLVRASVPDAYINPHSKDTVCIFFLGGSTMYGESATDRETIPSAFVNAYKELYPDGRSIRVVNYGMRGSHSYGELMLLSHLIYTGSKPGVVVVMDGLNDFLLVNASGRRIPYYYYHLKATGKDDIDYRALHGVIDSTNRFMELPSGKAGVDSLLNVLIDQYQMNERNMADISIRNGIQPFFFIQPVCYYHYPNRKNDPVCDGNGGEFIERAYGMLEKKTDTAERRFFLGDLLENAKGYPFIDHFHYSPPMSAVIARAMVAKVGRGINGY